MLTHLYGIAPWDVDRLSPVELEDFMVTAEQILRAKGGE